MLSNAQTIAENILALAKQMGNPTQPELAERMGISPKTLWTLKEGAGNPQLGNIEKAAAFFKRPAWQLLVKNGHKLPRDFDPWTVPTPDVPAGHVRIVVLDAVSSAVPSGGPVDYPAVLGHIDVAEGWARKRLGNNLDGVRALPVAGDSMSPTINEGDLAFVDTRCTGFEVEGIYVIVFNNTLLIKRLSADLATRRIEVKSDNDHHKTQQVTQDDLTICGRVKAWLALRSS